MMREQQQLPSASPLLSRGVAWFVIACAAGSLALSAAARLTGDSVRWTAWTLPLLIAGNTAVLLLGALNRWPRLVWSFMVLSLTLAGAVIVSEIMILMHR